MLGLLIVAIVLGMMMYLCIVLAQAMLPCDKCPLRKQCKKLEDEGYPNICTQNMLNPGSNTNYTKYGKIK